MSATSRLRRPLRCKLCRVHLENTARFRKGLDVVTIKIKQIGNQPRQCAGAQARHNRAALRERLQNAVEL